MAVATPSGGGSAGLRWLAIPLAIALLALIGLGASAESRDQFRHRLDTSELGGGRTDGPSARPGDVPRTDQDWPATGRDGALGDGGPASGTPGSTGSPTGDARPGEAAPGSTPVDVEIRSPDGSVGLELGDDGTTARPSGTPDSGSGDSGSGDGPVVLRPDGQGDIAGLRVTEDGSLEPVTADELRPDDLRLRPTDDGVDLIRPDGTVIQLRPGTDGTGVTVTEVAPDGTARELIPDENGEIDLGDGTTLATAPPDRGLWQDSVPWRWVFGGIVTIVAASLALAGYLYLTRPEHGDGSGLLGPSGVPIDRFEEFLASLAADDDHPRAIRLAFQAAERGVGMVPARRSTETPFEWAERVAAGHPRLARPVSELCTLFATARFAPERPTAEDRDRAVSLLRQLHQPHVGGDPVDVATTQPV